MTTQKLYLYIDWLFKINNNQLTNFPQIWDGALYFPWITKVYFNLRKYTKFTRAKFKAKSCDSHLLPWKIKEKGRKKIFFEKE